MILDAYYKIEHQPGGRSKTRMDEVSSTGNYEPFEALRNRQGQFFLYFCDTPDTFKAEARRKADKILSNRHGNNMSSVYIPNIRKRYGNGDVKTTPDGALFILNEDATAIEVFISKGNAHNRGNLYTLLCDGELDTEIEALRKQAETRGAGR